MPGTHTESGAVNVEGRKEGRAQVCFPQRVTGYLLDGKQNEIRFVLENSPTPVMICPQLAHTSGAGRPRGILPCREDRVFLVPQPTRGSGSAGRFGVTNIAAVFLAVWSPDFRGNRNLLREEPSGAERSSLRLPS